MANALSLGQAEVLSHLGQPLHISVPLRATTEELWTTEASIASKEEFELLSIDYQTHFSDIQVLIHSYQDAHGWQYPEFYDNSEHERNRSNTRANCSSKAR